MEIEQAVREAVLAIPKVAEIAGPRVYHDHRLQTSNEAPAVEIGVEDLDTPTVLDGGDGTGLAQVRVRCLSKYVFEAEAMMMAVRAALEGFSGDWSGLQIDSVIQSEGESDAWQDTGESSGIGMSSMEAVFEVSYQLED